MIVDHLSLWKEYQVARLTGEPPRPSGWAEKLDWHEIRDTGEPAWQAAVERLRNAQKRLLTGLKTRTDEDLARPLPGGTSPLYKIQSMAPHDAYHCGQIRLLRALQGVPAKPSDRLPWLRRTSSLRVSLLAEEPVITTELA